MSPRNLVQGQLCHQQHPSEDTRSSWSQICHSLVEELCTGRSTSFLHWLPGQVLNLIHLTLILKLNLRLCSSGTKCFPQSYLTRRIVRHWWAWFVYCLITHGLSINICIGWKCTEQLAQQYWKGWSQCHCGLLEWKCGTLWIPGGLCGVRHRFPGWYVLCIQVSRCASKYQFLSYWQLAWIQGYLGWTRGILFGVHFQGVCQAPSEDISGQQNVWPTDRRPCTCNSCSAPHTLDWASPSLAGVLMYLGWTHAHPIQYQWRYQQYTWLWLHWSTLGQEGMWGCLVNKEAERHQLGADRGGGICLYAEPWVRWRVQRGQHWGWSHEHLHKYWHRLVCPSATNKSHFMLIIY